MQSLSEPESLNSLVLADIVHLERHPGATVLSMEYGKVNAFDGGFFRSLGELLAEIPTSDPLVLSGHTRVFSAGVDLRAYGAFTEDETSEFLRLFCQSLVDLFARPGPVIAAIDGHAMGGGMLLALAADIRVMGGGSMGLAEMRVGVPFPAPLVEIARYALGAGAARAIVMASPLSAQQSLDAGWVDEVVESGQALTRALEHASRLGSLPQGVFALTKKHLRGAAVELMRAQMGNLGEVQAVWNAPAVREQAVASLERRGAAHP